MDQRLPGLTKGQQECIMYMHGSQYAASGATWCGVYPKCGGALHLIDIPENQI